MAAAECQPSPNVRSTLKCHLPIRVTESRSPLATARRPRCAPHAPHAQPQAARPLTSELNPTFAPRDARLERGALCRSHIAAPSHVTEQVTRASRAFGSDPPGRCTIHCVLDGRRAGRRCAAERGARSQTPLRARRERAIRNRARNGAKARAAPLSDCASRARARSRTARLDGIVQA